MVIAYTSTCKREWDIIREADEPIPCGDGHIDYEYGYQSVARVFESTFDWFRFLVLVTISYLSTNVMLLLSFPFFSVLSFSSLILSDLLYFLCRLQQGRTRMCLAREGHETNMCHERRVLLYRW